MQAGAQGITTLEAVASWEDDARPENNRAFATVEVFASPRILMVTEDLGSASDFQQALVISGMEVSFMEPGDLPTDLETLEPYQIVILHNILAETLTAEQMLTLEVFVSQRGRGLIFIGGRNSYTLGGYENTPLETMLPVILEPPERKERPPVTLVLVLDRSGSMGQSRVTQVQPIELAREAAMRAIETLTPDDYLGVLTYSGDFVWDVNVNRLGDGLTLRLALDAVSRVKDSGGTNMFAALEEVVRELEITPTTETRHILLLSDGKSFDGSPEEFQALAEAAQALDVTISTISLGIQSDTETMALIADSGKGRYFDVLDPLDLPRILVSESRAARSENVQLGETALLSGEEKHPILAGFSLSELPTVSGYNALTSKVDQGAEDVLLSANFEDPLLSVWQLGLGRVAAWMSDLGEEWAGNWSGWSRQGQFWAQVVRYALPDPSLSPAQVDISVGPTRVTVDVQIQTPGGVPVNLADVEFSFADASGQAYTARVPQVGPGIYQLEFDRPVEGAYRGVVSYLGF